MTDQEEFNSTIRKFNRQGHALPADVDIKNCAWIYQHCLHCNTSVYLWATNGQFPCKQVEAGRQTA